MSDTSKVSNAELQERVEALEAQLAELQQQAPPTSNDDGGQANGLYSFEPEQFDPRRMTHAEVVRRLEWLHNLLVNIATGTPPDGMAQDTRAFGVYGYGSNGLPTVTLPAAPTPGDAVVEADEVNLHAAANKVWHILDPTVYATVSPGDTFKINDRGHVVEVNGTPVVTGIVPAPVISPSSGDESSPITISITDSDGSATIMYRYNTDGGLGWSSWAVWAPGALDLPVYAGTTSAVEAYATRAGYSPSATTTATYTLTSAGTLSTPTYNHGTGTYNNDVTTTITYPAGSTCFITTDGSAPAPGGINYILPVVINATATVLKAIAVQAGWTNSAIASATYTLKCATPVASPAGGSYSSTQSVTLTTATIGAAIYYTTDGSTPDSGSTLYTGAISVSTSETIKAIAIRSNYVDSDVMSEAYAIGAAEWVLMRRQGTGSPPVVTNFSGHYSDASTTDPLNYWLNKSATDGDYAYADWTHSHIAVDGSVSLTLDWTVTVTGGGSSGYVGIVLVDASTDTAISSYDNYGSFSAGSFSHTLTGSVPSGHGHYWVVQIAATNDAAAGQKVTFTSLTFT